MSNNKKTRKQKIIADLRHKLTLANSQNLPQKTASSNALLNRDKPHSILPPQPQYTFNHTNDTYGVSSQIWEIKQLYRDLKQTIMTSAFIVIFELMLFFTLQHHILRLFNLNY